MWLKFDCFRWDLLYGKFYFSGIWFIGGITVLPAEPLMDAMRFKVLTVRWVTWAMLALASFTSSRRRLPQRRLDTRRCRWRRWVRMGCILE